MLNKTISNFKIIVVDVFQLFITNFQIRNRIEGKLEGKVIFYYYY